MRFKSSIKLFCFVTEFKHNVYICNYDTQVITVRESLHVTKFSPLFSPIKKNGLHGNKLGGGWGFRLKQFWSIYWADWVTDIFVPKFYSLIQNNIGPNLSDRLNFVTCEYSLHAFRGYSLLGVVMYNCSMLQAALTSLSCQCVFVQFIYKSLATHN